MPHNAYTNYIQVQRNSISGMVEVRDNGRKLLEYRSMNAAQKWAHDYCERLGDKAYLSIDMRGE